MSTPLSQIRICAGVRLNNDYQHTIWFDSYDDQKEYFTGKVVKTFPAYTYLRKNWSIKVDATMAQAQGWNYLFFSNYDSAKFYYYFINDVQYVNDNTVELFIEMDLMQTYLFDYQLLPCMVDREHVKSDTPETWLIDEGLDTGDYVSDGVNDFDMNELCIMVLSSVNPNNGNKAFGGADGLVFSGLAVYGVDRSNSTKFLEKLLDLDTAGKSDGIFSIWMYPKKLVVIDKDETWDSEDVIAHRIMGIQHWTIEYNKDFEEVDNYYPENKKLFAYPYNFLYLTNNQGGSAVYRFEHFVYDTCTFSLWGSCSPEASTYVYPKNYKHEPNAFDDGLAGCQFPTCAWSQDVYKLWLAQNHNQREVTWNSNMIKAAVGAGTTMIGMGSLNMNMMAGGAALAYNSFENLYMMMAEKKDKMVQPPQAKGNQSSAINVNNLKATFTLVRKTVDEAHARSIDNFFTMHGYKCNEVKIPNRNVREQFTFTKTVGCSIFGEICASDKRKIETIYNNGVTFWVNGDNIGNYFLRNRPLLDL